MCFHLRFNFIAFHTYISIIYFYINHTNKIPTKKKTHHQRFDLLTLLLNVQKHPCENNVGRSMRSNHSTWDPRRPLYEELKAPPVPRRHYHGGSDDCYHAHPPGRTVFRMCSIFIFILFTFSIGF